MINEIIEVISVEPMENRRLRVELSNGKKGVFDVSPYMSRGVFRKLNDPEYFARADVFFSGIGWPGEEAPDISPYAIDAELKTEESQLAGKVETDSVRQGQTRASD